MSGSHIIERDLRSQHRNKWWLLGCGRGEVKGACDRDNDLPSNPRRDPHYSLPQSYRGPIGTLSRRRHRYNNVACQSIRPISRELKLQRGSFRVNFPAIKTGNVRNCGKIAIARPSHPHPHFPHCTFRRDFDALAFIIDRVTSTSTLTKWRRVELTSAFRLLLNYALNFQLSITH